MKTAVEVCRDFVEYAKDRGAASFGCSYNEDTLRKKFSRFLQDRLEPW